MNCEEGYYSRDGVGDCEKCEGCKSCDKINGKCESCEPGYYYIPKTYKCSKCGLCKSVCPIFLATKNEVLSPRGRFIILNNFFNNQKKLSKKFLNNLDYCLNCNLCKKFCWSRND